MRGVSSFSFPGDPLYARSLSAIIRKRGFLNFGRGTLIAPKALIIPRPVTSIVSEGGRRNPAVDAAGFRVGMPQKEG